LTVRGAQYEDKPEHSLWKWARKTGSPAHSMMAAAFNPELPRIRATVRTLREMGAPQSQVGICPRDCCWMVTGLRIVANLLRMSLTNVFKCAVTLIARHRVRDALTITGRPSKETRPIATEH